jgi:hypothetical protein
MNRYLYPGVLEELEEAQLAKASKYTGGITGGVLTMTSPQ